MALIVQKYGGSSVGTIDRIRNVARRLIETKEAGNKVVAVISAMSGVTRSSRMCVSATVRITSRRS